MEHRPAAKVFLLSMGTTAAILAASCFLDWVFGESDAVLIVMILEGLLLLFLPAAALRLENLMKEELPSKKFLLAYFGGYAVTAALGCAVICSGVIDYEKLFPGEFLGGIMMLIMLLILSGGLLWSAIFRLGAAFCVPRDKR